MWPFGKKNYVIFSAVYSAYYADPKYNLTEVWTSNINKAMRFTSGEADAMLFRLVGYFVVKVKV